MKARTQPQQVICLTESRGNRLITVVGGIPFYKSTGINSREKGTWFPFIGIQEASIYGYPKGALLKPSISNIQECFPEKLASYLTQNSRLLGNLITRLGNFETMCVSMLIGGGFWNDDEGEDLNNFIQTHYKKELFSLKESLSPIIHDMELCRNPEEVSNIRAEYINRWLAGHESKADRNSYGLNLNLNYKTLQILDIKDKNTTTYLTEDCNLDKDNLAQDIQAQLKKLKIEGMVNGTWKDANSRYPQKYRVLEAALQYLDDSIDLQKLNSVLDKNSKYNKGFSAIRTETGKLLDEVLKLKEDIKI